VHTLMGLETNLNFMRQRFSWRAQRACLPWPFFWEGHFLFGIYASKLPGRLAGRLCGVWWTNCLFGSVSEDTHKQGRPGERKCTLHALQRYLAPAQVCKATCRQR